MSASPSLPHIARRIGTPYALAKPFDPDQLLLLIERALCEGHFPRPPISPLTLAEPNGLGQA